MSKIPSPNGRNLESGRFLPGNSGGPGNPHGGRALKLRAALLEAITPEDIAEVAKSLVQAAKSGDVQSAKLLFDRVIGKPEAPTREDEIERGTMQLLEMLERTPNPLLQNRGAHAKKA